MRFVVVPLVLAACTAWGAAKRPVEIEALVDRARGAPAEFAADALLRIAASGKIADEAWKSELLEEAFRRAAGAQQPVKRRAAGETLRGAPVDFLNRAFAQDLDALSLQCRAVRAMLLLDPAKARQWFTQIPRPRAPRVSCEDALTYDVSAYYETLGAVAGRGFTPAEIAEDEPFNLIEGCLRGLSSPVEVGPIARLLATLKLKRPQREALAAGFSASLKDLSGDDRSFYAAVGRNGRAGTHIAALAKLAPAPVALIEAYRAFLVRHLSGERCADSDEAPRPAVSFGLSLPAPVESGPAQYFNDSLRVDPIPPISRDEVQPAKVEGAAGGLRTCESPECKLLATRYMGLILSPEGRPFTSAEKSSEEWKARLKEYLSGLADWKQDSGGDAPAYFHQKCAFYSDLFNVVPNGPDRELVVRHFLDFLSRTSFQRDSRVEWFLPVNSLIGRVFLEPASMQELVRDLRNFSDPVIALYAELEAFAPRAPGSALSVM